MNSTLWKIICSFNPKAQAVNKAQRQLRPEPYFPEFFKSRALEEKEENTGKDTCWCKSSSYPTWIGSIYPPHSSLLLANIFLINVRFVLSNLLLKCLCLHKKCTAVCLYIYKLGAAQAWEIWKYSLLRPCFFLQSTFSAKKYVCVSKVKMLIIV